MFNSLFLVASYRPPCQQAHCNCNYIPLSRPCNKNHTVPSGLYYYYYTVGKGSSWYKNHIAWEILVFYAIYMATRPRARACIFHKTLGLMLYLLHTRMPYVLDHFVSSLRMIIISQDGETALLAAKRSNYLNPKIIKLLEEADTSHVSPYLNNAFTDHCVWVCCWNKWNESTAGADASVGMPNLYDNEAASYYVDTHKNICMLEFNGAKKWEIIEHDGC